MRVKALVFLVLTFFSCFAEADNAITFSHSLPKPWVLLSSQLLPGTNTVTHNTFADNITVLGDPTNQTTMLISVAPAAAAQTSSNLTSDAGNWIHSVISRFGENLNLVMTRLDLKTENKRTFAEAAFTIQLQDATFFGTARYEVTGANVIRWVAFGSSEAIVTNQTVLRIATSVRVRK